MMANMTKTEAVWQGFIKHGDEMTADQCEANLRSQGFDTPGAGNKPLFYKVRRYFRHLRDVIHQRKTISAEEAKVYIEGKGASSFSEVVYNHLKAKAQSNGQMPTKIEAARQILRDKGVDSTVEVVEQLLRERGFTGSHEALASTIHNARREMKTQMKEAAKPVESPSLEGGNAVVAKPEVAPPIVPNNRDSDPHAHSKPVAPKQVVPVDLATYRKFAALVKRHGMDNLLEVVSLVTDNGLERIQYMAEVYSETQPK